MNETYAGHTAEALRALAAAAPHRRTLLFYGEAGLTCNEDVNAFYEAARLALPAALDRVAALEAEARDARLVLAALIESLGGEITVTAGALIESPRKIQVWRESDGSMTLRTSRAALGEASHDRT